MVDLIALKLELAHARRARIEAELAGANLERMIERMRVGRTLQQIELEEQAAAEPLPPEPLLPPEPSDEPSGEAQPAARQPAAVMMARMRKPVFIEGPPWGDCRRQGNCRSATG